MYFEDQKVIWKAWPQDTESGRQLEYSSLPSVCTCQQWGHLSQHAKAHSSKSALILLVLTSVTLMFLHFWLNQLLC